MNSIKVKKETKQFAQEIIDTAAKEIDILKKKKIERIEIAQMSISLDGTFDIQILRFARYDKQPGVSFWYFKFTTPKAFVEEIMKLLIHYAYNVW